MKPVRRKKRVKSSRRNIYGEESLHRFVDDDMITSEEEGFMQGYIGR